MSGRVSSQIISLTLSPSLTERIPGESLFEQLKDFDAEKKISVDHNRGALYYLLHGDCEASLRHGFDLLCQAQGLSMATSPDIQAQISRFWDENSSRTHAIIGVLFSFFNRSQRVFTKDDYRAYHALKARLGVADETMLVGVVADTVFKESATSVAFINTALKMRAEAFLLAILDRQGVEQHVYDQLFFNPADFPAALKTAFPALIARLEGSIENTKRQLSPVTASFDARRAFIQAGKCVFERDASGYAFSVALMNVLHAKSADLAGRGYMMGSAFHLVHDIAIELDDASSQTWDEFSLNASDVKTPLTFTFNDFVRVLKERKTALFSKAISTLPYLKMIRFNLSQADADKLMPSLVKFGEPYVSEASHYSRLDSTVLDIASIGTELSSALDFGVAHAADLLSVPYEADKSLLSHDSALGRLFVTADNNHLYLAMRSLIDGGFNPSLISHLFAIGVGLSAQSEHEIRAFQNEIKLLFPVTEQVPVVPLPIAKMNFPDYQHLVGSIKRVPASTRAALYPEAMRLQLLYANAHLLFGSATSAYWVNSAELLGVHPVQPTHRRVFSDVDHFALESELSLLLIEKSLSRSLGAIRFNWSPDVFKGLVAYDLPRIEALLVEKLDRLHDFNPNMTPIANVANLLEQVMNAMPSEILKARYQKFYAKVLEQVERLINMQATESKKPCHKIKEAFLRDLLFDSAKLIARKDFVGLKSMPSTLDEKYATDKKLIMAGAMSTTASCVHDFEALLKAVPAHGGFSMKLPLAVALKLFSQKVHRDEELELVPDSA